MRRDFNHEYWLANLDRLDMTHGGSWGTHEGSGEPHEGSGVSYECHMSSKKWLKGPKTHLEFLLRSQEVNHEWSGGANEGSGGGP